MRRMVLLAPLFAAALAGCAANHDQMIARAASENETARSEAERAFLATGYRPVPPPPGMTKLVLRGASRACSETTHTATDPFEVLVGTAPAVTTYEAACALGLGRTNQLSVHLQNETAVTLLTRIWSGSKFAVSPSGTMTHYLLVGQVKKQRTGFEKGVSCCCDMPSPPPDDVTFDVAVAYVGAPDEVFVPYDSVAVTFCDPAAPQ